MKIPSTGSSGAGYGSNFRPKNAPSGPVVQYSALPKTSAPKRSSTSTHRSPSYSSPYSGHTGSSRGTGSNFKPGGGSGGGPVAKAPTPVIPDVNTYLKGDTTYQQQIAQLRKAFLQYQASQKNDSTQYDTQYGLNVKNLGTDRTRSFSDLQDDYAGRGLLTSGVYGKAYSDLQSDYDARQTQLDSQRSSFLSDLATSLSNFQGDQQTATTSAKQEAIARRAAKYGG